MGSFYIKFLRLKPVSISNSLFPFLKIIAFFIPIKIISLPITLSEEPSLKPTTN